MTGPDFDLLKALIDRDPDGVRALYQKYGLDPAGISPETLAHAARKHGSAFTEDFYDIFREGPRPKKEMAALVGFGGDKSPDRSKFRQWFGRVTGWINGGADVVDAVNDSIVNPGEDNACPHCVAQTLNGRPAPSREPDTIFGIDATLFVLALFVVGLILGFAYFKYIRR